MTGISGLHGPNAPWGADDYRIARLMGARSVKLMRTAGTEHTAADLLTLRSQGVTDFTVRLRDSREPDGHYPSASDYVWGVLPSVRVFYSLGVRRLQVDNEPNVPGMWDREGFGPWQYQFFMRHVVGLLRAALPPDVVLVSPPLSFSPGLWRLGGANPTPYVLDDWLAAYHWTDGGRQPSLWRIFDEVGANVYWQSERQMQDTSYGLAYEQLHARSGGMGVCVLEYANSSEGPGVEEARCAQYPEWLSQASSSGMVRRAYAYISPGATPDWAAFRITDSVALAMAEAELRGQSRAVGKGRGLV